MTNLKKYNDSNTEKSHKEENDTYKVRKTNQDKIQVKNDDIK